MQQQALRDFARAMTAFFDPANPARRTGEVWVPKAGWVRFRWSRAVPPGVKSYRVTCDRAGRGHVPSRPFPRRSRPRATATGWALTGA